MNGLDYEIVKTEEGEFQVWTPDKTGGCIGSGKTVRDAFLHTIQQLATTIVALKEDFDSALPGD